MATTLKQINRRFVGKTEVRMFRRANDYAGVILPPQGAPRQFEGDDPDVLWRKLLAEVGRAHPDYFGFDGARSRFLGYFPQGFADPRYAEKERDYKDQAVAKVAAILPMEAAHAGGPEARLAAVRAFQATNLVFQVEKARIKDLLAGDQGDAFLAGAVRFAVGEIASGLDQMTTALRQETQASWPLLTYLPFLWRPDRHIFLKPKVTRDFADRVGHPFGRDYDQGIVPAVYESLLDLADQTRGEIAALGPRDLIDVQSFIWVVGAYPLEPKPTT